LLINALCNPYTPVYDLTLLCLGLLASVASLARGTWPGTSSAWLLRRDVQSSAAIVLLGPILSQGIAKATQCELQCMPLGLLCVAAYWLAYSLPFRRNTVQRTVCPASDGSLGIAFGINGVSRGSI
jgi:hypothetical protein